MKRLLLAIFTIITFLGSVSVYAQSTSSGAGADTLNSPAQTTSALSELITASIVLYPNPATDEVNVVYNPDANVKTIAIYNIIGKVVKVYNTMNNSSAKLNIDNIPSGIYFIRLMDNQGHIIATRKFTRQ